jgi:hypothetical protein
MGIHLNTLEFNGARPLGATAKSRRTINSAGTCGLGASQDRTERLCGGGALGWWR